ncbi:hypothetical protein [Burkholderia sp. BCC1977]|uniref:hypothetical protein n=1 Tax=Burkholderia sp. BCC1977 TaxID=2817440 RepID=UPI002ABE2F9F|nr:hypothetical protein [Burkholderia sp. BCC1977]
MSFELSVGVGQRCSLYGRSEYRSRFPTGSPGEKAGKDRVQVISAGDLARDTAQLAALRRFLQDCRADHYVDRTDPRRLAQALQRAVSNGDVVAVIEQARPSGTPGRANDERQSYSVTFTPSQLFKRPARTAASFGLPIRTRLRRPADDGIAIWRANPGDRLPDGSIARALTRAQPFEYGSDAPIVNEVLQLAGSDGLPGNNQAQNRQFKAVVKLMDLNKRQARLLHEEISGEGLGYHEILERAQDMFGGS